MDDRRQDQDTATMAPWDDGFVREPLPPAPRLPRPPRLRSMRALLGTLAALLVVAVVGTAVLVNRGPRTPAPPAASATPSAQATATIRRATPTSELMPKDYGWTQVTRLAGDVKFSASSPQRGYLCGMEQTGHITVGVTADGGQTWEFGPSPAGYEECSLQISPTNALDVVVNSSEGTCGEPCPRIGAHYSTDGGKTWTAAPIPEGTVAPGGAIWSGAYLYAWAGANKESGQSGFLKVSAHDSPFASLDLNSLLPGAQNVSIGSAVASGTKLYLNLTYTGCPSQDCRAIVASGDGGQTWTQVSNQSSIQLMYVVGNTLYAQEVVGTTTTLVLSSDDGASWTALSLPPLPDGRPLSLDTRRSSWVPTPDGTIFVTPQDRGVVAYLRAGAWTVIPFESWPGDLVAAVSLEANGQPQRVWSIGGAQSYLAGIYWHALP